MAQTAKKDRDFADRMKELRKKSRIGMDALAKATGFDTEYLESVERGDVRPPVSAIIRISEALKVDSGAFLSADKDHSRHRAESFDKRQKAYSYKTLTPDAQLKHIKAFNVSIDPEKEHAGVAFSHEGEEFIYVLQGRLDISVGAKNHSLKAGQSLHFDSNLAHKLKNPGKKKTELIVVVYTP